MIIFRSLIPLSTATPHAFALPVPGPLLSTASYGVSVSIGAMGDVDIWTLA